MEIVGIFPQYAMDHYIWGTVFFPWESQTSPSADEIQTESFDLVILIIHATIDHQVTDIHAF